MIAQVLADTFQGMADLDAELLQQIGLADAGQFQKLRGVDAAGADDCFFRRTGFFLLTIDGVADADAAFVLYQKALGVGIGLDGEVGS